MQPHVMMECGEAAAADAELLSQIVHGYKKSPWSASARNTALP